GERQKGVPRVGQKNRYQCYRGGDKGKGLVKESQGEGRMEGAYHPYRERGTRGQKAPQVSNAKYRNQARGHLESQFGGSDRVLDNPEKLMLDAFKGASSKARKALLFEDQEPEALVDVTLHENESLALVNSSGGHAEGSERERVVVEQRQSDLDGENLMAEGVLLSDSELLLEDGLEAKALEDTINGMEEMQDGKLKVKNVDVGAGGPSKKRSAPYLSLHVRSCWEKLQLRDYTSIYDDGI
ncbi:unnamed protein product, partial [Eruca vesicaria subsp. sativa]|nr:unnamed protein product [Eruca vesicaria subsp. sativa]